MVPAQCPLPRCYKNDKMNIFKEFESKVKSSLEAMVAAGDLPSGLDWARVTVEPPREAAHGDLSTNAAMVLAKPAGKPPRALADALVTRLAALPEVVGAEVAGPGFVNLRVDPTWLRSHLADALRLGVRYGDSTSG